MVHLCRVFVKIIILAIALCATSGFNISPKPNLIFKDPRLKTYKEQVRSSYFGYTINLRKSSVIIGAPRAQSTLKSQKNISEPGAIYKCPLSGAENNCKPYILDRYGNINRDFDGYSYESEIKNNQWLGASIDGGCEDTDKLVVCAPRLLSNKRDVDYTIHGICYWTKDTLSDDPLNVNRIAPLRLAAKQVEKLNDKYTFNHQCGEQGISVHVTANNREILIGAPGIFTWMGSVIRYDVTSQRTSIPDPKLWNQPYNSYFGYSVSSGYFDQMHPKRIFYVATAPNADELYGEAYIFSIGITRNGEMTMNRYFTFRGSQFGEYYGYAALAEDINGDGLSDVIITAPMCSSEETVEQGAVYVYVNRGRAVFKLQKKIISPIKGRGRFGLTISKVGDINQDGYNDVAIAAPFADNGVVFIYLGNSKGLRAVPSQKLEAIPAQSSWGPYMFGYGLSKGCDFDFNGFNDFAIGAPNAETVYVYRAYPVVKIHATINSLSREIKPNERIFKINICYLISTKSKIEDLDLALRIKADPQIERVTLHETNSGELAYNVTASRQKQCRLLNATVRFSAANIYKPIELEMHYELVNGVPNSEEFCTKCAAVDPAEPKVSVEKIIFSTGCKTDICTADLKVTSSGLTPTYIIGSSRTINVTYEVSNSGEIAYLPQIKITSSIPIPCGKIPSSCYEQEDSLVCDLNRGQLMAFGNINNITIIYDVSQIEGTSLTLTASVFSTGNELNSADNVVSNIIALKEFTEIEAIGKALTPIISLKKVFNTTEVINSYEIKNNGPSRIQELEIAFEIPTAYKMGSLTAPIIDANNITVQGVYDQQVLDVEFYQNFTLRLADTMDISTTESISTELQPNANNPYSAALTSEDEFDIIQKESLELLSEKHVGALPFNRTVTFSCINSERTFCTRAVLKVYNFQPDMVITINLTYVVDLKNVDEILTEPWEFFVIIPKLDILKRADKDGNTTHITKQMEYNVITKRQLYKTPLWVIILAVLGGLLVLAAIVYGMRKAGFFRRKTKEEMEKLVQEHQQATKEAVDKFIKEQEDAENADYTEIPENIEDCKKES